MTEIDVALARRLVDRQFPQWSELPITAVEFDGCDNRSFRLGSELTVRLPSGPWYVVSVPWSTRGRGRWRPPRRGPVPP